jgi:peroxiredoxin
MNNQALLVLVLAMEGVILISFCTLFYQLLKQQGRILLRLDDLEQGATLRSAAECEQPELQPTGLSVGAQFPTFSFPDATGHKVSLKDFEGKRALLIHWNVECGFCAAIGKELALLEDSLIKQKAQLVLFSLAEASANRKQAKQLGLKSPILLAKDGSEALEAFNDFGTPAAYLLDEQGRVAHTVVVGSDQVQVLAHQLAAGTERKRLPGERPLAESRIERDGLKAGTPAPGFRMPDLNGRMVSPDDYRGRKLLLVFTDPDCGPCDQIAPELARLERQHQGNGLALVMVGRGDSEENRKKAREHRIDFPVVLQKKWELSKQYGIFATPVAFLINEEGVIAREAAAGADAILEVVSNQRGGMNHSERNLFDEAARVLAMPISRRKAFKHLAAGFAGALLSFVWPKQAQAWVGRPCGHSCFGKGNCIDQCYARARAKAATIWGSMATA